MKIEPVTSIFVVLGIVLSGLAIGAGAQMYEAIYKASNAGPYIGDAGVAGFKESIQEVFKHGSLIALFVLGILLIVLGISLSIYNYGVKKGSKKNK